MSAEKKRVGWYEHCRRIGMCPRCGVKGITKSYCPDCMKRIGSLVKARRAKLKGKGLCIVCGLSREASRGLCCDVCQSVRTGWQLAYEERLREARKA